MAAEQDEEALRRLERVTGEVGSDPKLIQGAGGNTSLKCGDMLWVKASGAWMRDARKRSIFVSLPLSALREAAHEGDGARADGLARAHVSHDGLRPSIESSLHAVMPHKAVIHAHAINSVVCAALADGDERFARAMKQIGATHGFIPYVKPGAMLASVIAQTIRAEGAADVLLLQNHGIIVGGPDPETAAHLLRCVERALEFPVRDFPAAAGMSAEDAGEFEPAEAHSGVARDPFLCAVLASRALSPDQVVFLGGAPGLVMERESLQEAALRTERQSGLSPVLLYFPGRGAYQRTALSDGQVAASIALAEVARRIPDGAAVVGLSRAQSLELVSWEAERFRRDLDAARR